MTFEIRKAFDIGDIHVNLPLSSMSVAYATKREEYIADKVFPKIPVPWQNGRYYTYGRDTFFRNRGRKWIPGTPMPQSSFDLDNTPTYGCEFRAFEYPLRWDLAKNMDSVIQIEKTTAEYIAQALLQGREQEWADTFFKTTVWTDRTGVTSNPNATQFVKWSDYVNSNPIEDMTKARLTIKAKTGMDANTIVMSQEVYEKVRIHPILKEMYKYTQVPIIEEDMIAKVFGVQKLYVAKATYATSLEGVGDDNYTGDFIFGKHAWLGYVPDAPSLMMPASGYHFVYTGMGAGYDIAIQRVPDIRHMVDYTQGFMCYDQKVIGKDLGIFFSGAVA